MSSTDTTTDDNPIPPLERIAVTAGVAAQMMSCSRSTFFQRVKDGIYPRPGRDGLWSVAALRAVHQPVPADAT